MEEKSAEKQTCTKREWTLDETTRLKEMYRTSPALWVKNQLPCPKYMKDVFLQRIADEFKTNIVSVVKKLTMLRTQFNEEWRKIEKQSAIHPQGPPHVPKWIYYNQMSFLAANRSKNQDAVTFDTTAPNNKIDSFTDGSEKQYEFIHLEDLNCNSTDEIQDTLVMQVVNSTSRNISQLPQNESTTSSFDDHPQPSTSQKQVYTKKRKFLGTNCDTDEYDLFANFIAQELRNLRNEDNRMKLKCDIVRALLKAMEAEKE